MPTGPEHYKAAEDGITASTWQRQEWGEGEDPQHQADALEAANWELRVAQVHATLAHAAAKAMADGDWMPSQDSAAWREAAGGKEPAAGTQASREEELKLLAGAMLATFIKGQDGYRARVGQVQIERWRAALDGAQ